MSKHTQVDVSLQSNKATNVANLVFFIKSRFKTIFLILDSKVLKENLCAFAANCIFLFYSVCSGLVAALMGTPSDVIKTRIMNQPTKDGKYVSMVFIYF